jgi:cytochrome subunit of sulfide dehydrogenase
MRNLLVMLALAVPAYAVAADMPAGANSCSGCHAESAKVQSPVPPLRGRTDIAEAMRAFRSGERPGTVMDRIAKGFSDSETAAIAAWFAAQKAAR